MESRRRIVAVVAGLLLVAAAILTGFARDVVDILIALFELFDLATGIVTAIIGVAIGAPIVMILLNLTGKKEKLIKEERHPGVITRVDDDYTEVTLETPSGREYCRYFETVFLKACGVTRPGEELELAFRTVTDGTSVTVTMRVAKIGEAPKFTDEELKELKELFGKVDLEKIRAAFGSHGRPE